MRSQVFSHWFWYQVATNERKFSDGRAIFTDHYALFLRRDIRTSRSRGRSFDPVCGENTADVTRPISLIVRGFYDCSRLNLCDLFQTVNQSVSLRRDRGVLSAR